jgi:hypothetical protein
MTAAPVTTDNNPESRSKLLDALAALAKIPEQAKPDFIGRVERAIEAAHREFNVPKLRLFASSEITRPLAVLERNVRKLSKLLVPKTPSRSRSRVIPLAEATIRLLATMNLDWFCASTAADLAGNSLTAALIERGRDARADVAQLKRLLQAVSVEDARSDLSSLIPLLETFAEAASEAKVQASFDKGRPSGLSGYVAFEVFVKRLLFATWSGAGTQTLTIYRSEYTETGWDGHLHKAIETVEPLLPAGIVPSSGLDNTLFRLANEVKRARYPGGDRRRKLP